jgi:hypothetical protein
MATFRHSHALSHAVQRRVQEALVRGAPVADLVAGRFPFQRKIRIFEQV